MDPALDIRWSWRCYVLSNNGWLRSRRKWKEIKRFTNPAPRKNRSNNLWSQACSPRELTIEAGRKSNHGSWHYARDRNRSRAIYHDFTREVSERKELALTFEQHCCFQREISPTTPSGAPDFSLCVTLVKYEKLSLNNEWIPTRLFAGYHTYTLLIESSDIPLHSSKRTLMMCVAKAMSRCLQLPCQNRVFTCLLYRVPPDDGNPVRRRNPLVRWKGESWRR